MTNDADVRGNTQALNNLVQALKKLTNVLVAMNTNIATIGQMIKDEIEETSTPDQDTPAGG